MKKEATEILLNWRPTFLLISLLLIIVILSCWSDQRDVVLHLKATGNPFQICPTPTFLKSFQWIFHARAFKFYLRFPHKVEWNSFCSFREQVIEISKGSILSLFEIPWDEVLYKQLFMKALILNLLVTFISKWRPVSLSSPELLTSVDVKGTIQLCLISLCFSLHIIVLIFNLWAGNVNLIVSLFYVLFVSKYI